MLVLRASTRLHLHRTRNHALKGHRKSTRCGTCHIVATSEFWWEDEEEFDSLTDAAVLKAKRVVLVGTRGSGADGDALRTYLQPVEVHAAFASPAVYEFAEQVWKGRDGAPYFHKVKRRIMLEEADMDVSAAQGLWEELLQQNWRIELDAGLGVDEVQTETLLLFSSPAGVQRMLQVALPHVEIAAQRFESSTGTTVSVVHVGLPDREDSTRSLHKELVLLAEMPTGINTLSP